MNELIDPDQQIRVELWEYAPRQFANDGVVGDLSLALSFNDNADERIERSYRGAIRKVMGGISGIEF